jgi:hypothetical protein
MARLEKAWMTFGIATFLLQLISLASNASVIVSVLVIGLFIVGCGLGFVTIFRIVHHFTESTNTKVIKYRVENNKVTKAERYLKQLLTEDDVEADSGLHEAS